MRTPSGGARLWWYVVAFVLMADLSRSIRLPLMFDFMDVSSYGAATHTSGVVRILKAAAGFALAVAARGFLASTRLLWFSAGLSVAAIVAAVASVVWPAARPEP